jgi:cytochrome c5
MATFMERFTISRPWMVGSALREARAAAARAAAVAGAVGGETRLAVVAAMRTEGPEEAASLLRRQSKPLHAAGLVGKRRLGDGRIWSRRSKRTPGGGDQAGGAAASPFDAMVARAFPFAILASILNFVRTIFIYIRKSSAWELENHPEMDS